MDGEDHQSRLLYNDMTAYINANMHKNTVIRVSFRYLLRTVLTPSVVFKLFLHFRTPKTLNLHAV